MESKLRRGRFSGYLNCLQRNDSIRNELDLLQTELIESFEKTYKPLSKFDVSWQEVQKKLKSGETAIEFAHFLLKNDNGELDRTVYLAYIFSNEHLHPTVVPLIHLPPKHIQGVHPHRYPPNPLLL